MTLKTGGWSREITSRELAVDDTMAVVDMNLSPGVREMHTHLQSEFGFVLQGGARVTAIDERIKEAILNIIHFQFQSYFPIFQEMFYQQILDVMNQSLM